MFVFGDSFSNNISGWPGLIGSKTTGINGSSEFRIFNTYMNKANDIGDEPIVFCHTHWSRIYLKDTVPTITRNLATHPLCDLVLGDVIAKKDEAFVKTLETIWDQDFFKTSYELLVQRLLQVPNSIHITFFNDIHIEGVHNLHFIWKQHPGKINHLSDVGNTEVASFIEKVRLLTTSV